MVYFKLFESQLPVVEKALYVASRMVRTERSRGVLFGAGLCGFSAGGGVFARGALTGDSPPL